MFIHMEAVIMYTIPDVQSLTEFQRNARAQIKDMKATGNPIILTVNGKAEVVVQDFDAHRTMLRAMQEAEDLQRLRRRIDSANAGNCRDFEEVFDELEMKYFGKIVSKPLPKARKK